MDEFCSMKNSREKANMRYGKTRYSVNNSVLSEIEKSVVRINIIKDLLSELSDINKKYSGGRTLLHVAVLKKRPEFEVVKLLLDYGADVNVSDDNRNTPLHSSVATRTEKPSDQAIMVKILLDAGADINALNKYQKTPFNVAITARKINRSLIQELLSRGANFNLKMKKSALWCAVKNRNLRYDVIKVLLDYGVGVDIEALHRAVENPNCTVEIVEAILSQGVDVNYSIRLGYTALHLSIRSRCNADIVETLLKWGADANSQTSCPFGLTPLLCAVLKEKCPLSVVKVLLKYGANVDGTCAKGITPLMYAAKYCNDKKILAELLIQGADPNYRNNDVSSIHMAVCNQFENMNLLKLLLEYGGNINNANPVTNFTPLLQLLTNHYTINRVKALLQNGARVQSAKGLISPLEVVMRHGLFSEHTIPVIREILKYTPKKQLYEGIIFDAFRNPTCCLDVIKGLLELGVNVHLENLFRKTPLQIAMETPRLRFAIEPLLEYDAWCTEREPPWKTTFQEAISCSQDLKLPKLLIKFANLQNCAPTFNFFSRFLREKYPDLLNYSRSCESELKAMSELSVRSRPPIKLVQLSELIRERKESEAFDTFQDAVLEILTTNSFPLYSDVLARKLKKSVLIESVTTMKIYAQRDEPYQHDVILTPDVVRVIANYLPNVSLANLLLALSADKGGSDMKFCAIMSTAYHVLF